MLRRGLTNADVAMLTGLSLSTVKSLKAGMPRSRGQALVERALGMPFWTQAAVDWSTREAIRLALGTDPALASVPELRRLAAAADCRGRSGCRTRHELIALIAAHVAKNPAQPAPAAPNPKEQPAAEGAAQQE